MLSLIPALVLGVSFAFTPTDDVWVYPNASDPANDPVLRVWGSEGVSVPEADGSTDAFSFAYIKWKLEGIPDRTEPESAKLILHQSGKPGFTLEQSKQFPLEARPLNSNFSEKSWSYDLISKLMPAVGTESFYGAGSITEDAADGAITIDLMSGKANFGKAVARALSDAKHEIAVALTSKMDAGALGRAAIYRFRAREDKDPTMQPQLVLTFARKQN